MSIINANAYQLVNRNLRERFFEYFQVRFTIKVSFLFHLSILDITKLDKYKKLKIGLFYRRREGII